jgi:ABC-type dipeptide/oligopeptide/nickel transport system permease subunit
MIRSRRRASVMQPPIWDARGTWVHPLGTDGQGRDMLSRLFYGTRLTLIIGLVSVGIGGVLGSFMGLMAAFRPAARSVDHAAGGCAAVLSRDPAGPGAGGRLRVRGRCRW